MERRIDRVRIDVAGTMVALDWAERLVFVVELKRGTKTLPLAKALEGAGTTRALTIGGEDVDDVLGVLARWAKRVGELPPGVEKLRKALHSARP